MKLQSVFAISALGFSACMTNQSGHLGSSQNGDTSRPAERRSPLSALHDACGDGAPTAFGETTLQRQPYLQQVTTDAALVGWVTGDIGAQHVEITAPGGAALQTAPAEPEQLAVRTAGEDQMWTQLGELAPESIYCYTVNDTTQRLTEPTGFRTAPTADSTEPVRFLAFGDSGGGGADQFALLEQMYTVPYELMIHTGDLAYDNGTLGQYEETVFGVYKDLFRSIPFFPASGNHDYKTLQGAPFRDVFALPGGNGEKWYSYDWGRVHFVALDTEADYDTQVAWLDRDLAATELPWKIVYMHRPPYSSGSHGSDTGLRARLAPVLENHGVQLVLAGHDHHYERMTPQNGVAYVVTGGGGVGTRSVGKSSFTAFSEDVIHFVHVEVAPDELVLHAIDAAGREFDSMTVAR
jgi:hypothetical protein